MNATHRDSGPLPPRPFHRRTGMFSPIGKKKLIVELKRVPLNQREEYLKTHLKDSLQKKTNSSPSRSPSPKKDKAHSSSPPRVRTPLVQTIAAGSSATRNLDYILQEETLLGEVTRKIADVAVRYRRERDAVLLTVFNSNALSYQEFRDHLNRSFRLKFTDEEFTEVIKLFDNDGDGGIDGSEFLVCFTKLASIVKAKEAAAVREKQFQYEQMMKQKEEEKKYNLERKHELLVDYEFSEETRERALAKMTDAAKKYDKNHPAAVSLDGFDGQFLLPAEFKEILKRTFGLKLSPTELGALIKEFDQNGDGHVECSEFLITFFKLGFAARERDLVEQREKQQRMTAEMEEKKKNKMKELEEKVELAVDYDFSEADEARMHAKLKEAAKKYDRYHPASVGLEGFDVQFMKPGVFREMVKRTFHLTLTGKELGAAVKTFDKIGDGTIPCRDFLMHFHQIGYTEKNHERLLQIQKQRELDRIAEEERVRKLKAIEEKVTVPIAETCERSDLEKAFEKLRVAALKYDRSHPSAVSLDGFEGSYLTPGVFRELLKRTFNIKLTPTELKAMVTEFSISSAGVSGGTGGGSGGAGVGAGGEVSRGSGEVSAEISGDEPHEKVSCAEFLKQFFKLSFEEKSKIHHEMLQKQREAEKAAEAEEDRKRRETEERMSLEVDYDFQEKDEKTALEKITKAAIKYDKNHPSAPCLDGFGGAFMTPYVFKDMLFRAFHIKLSPKELGATMKHFDKDLSGTVDCSEFLNSFFRLGFEKRSEMHHKQLEKQKEANYQRTRSELVKLCEQEKKMNLKLDWEFTDDDLKNVNEKITEAAMKYDKNHPASVSLDGFESQKLAPGIFREMIRRTFNIQLNPRELAAMLTVFESDKDGNIDTRNFVTKFMRIGLEKREEFKLEMLQKQRNLMKKHKLEREEKIANQWKKMEAMVDIDFQFGPEDEERAMRRLVKAAMKYEKNAVSSPSLEGFSCVYLQPGAFKEMLKRTFNLHVNGKQLGSLVKRFEHPDHVNAVDCSMFVINFLALGHQERRKQKAIKDELQRKFLKSTSGATGELQLGASSSTTAGEGAEEGGGKETREFSEMERKRMLSKLTEAAFKFDKQMPGAMSLDGFDALFLTPSEFKDLIKRTFNLRLDSSEFNALLVRYDPEHSQRIVSKDFLTDFLQIGIREREKLKIKNLEKNRLGLKLQRQEEIRKLNEAEKKIMKEISLEFTAEEQRVAFEKLSQGAMRYDKTHPSAVGLEGFEVNSLHYGEFRELLKQTFHIILSDGELAAVVHHFDSKKEKRIASKDFLIYFFKLGFNERQKFHQEVLRRDREVTRQREREAQEKLELRWAQKEMRIDWEFSEKDLESGVEKLREAAREYDPQHPSAMSLSAFDALTMSPAVFREMLKRIMNISLTDKELSALVTHFDREGDHTVTCADFLVKFLTLGTQERNKITQQNRLKIIQKTKKVKQEEDLKEKLKTEKMEACVDYDFTHEQFASTMEKLKLAASTYDRNHPSAVSLDGFQGSSLSPGVFREMLKRTFNIKLDPGELGAAVKFFDSDGDGTIDTAEFLKHFFKLQRTERSAVRRQRIQAEREVKKKLEDEVKERIRQKALEDETKMSFGPEDEKSLLRKIIELSEIFATDSSSFVSSMQAFKGPALPPIAFREVFYRVFLVRLTFPEVGALMNVLDEGGTGTIDGTKFMNSFFRLGRIQEKALLGEQVTAGAGGTGGVISLTSLDCLKPVSEPLKTDSFMSTSSSKKQSSSGSRAQSAPKSPEDLRHSAIQASDEDISSFTEVTLGHSWVLPPTIKSKASASSPTTTPSSKKQISEQNFDDFEPFILVPRSPESREKNRYHPNLKDFPMPSTGPPQTLAQRKKGAGLEFSKKAQNKNSPKKSRGGVNGGGPIEFQEMSLKKTTLSRTEAQTLHKSTSVSSSNSRPGTSEDKEKPEVNANQRVLKKQKMKRPVENLKVPSAPFFFPALLSAAPQINLAPVGYDITTQENALLYEDTENF